MKKILNFIKTFFRFLKAIFKYAIYGHFTEVSFEEFSKRISTCASCENLNKKKWKCNICGCYLTKKAKWSTEECPENKWNYENL